MSRRGYGGLSKLRKTFKRMEPEVQSLITSELVSAGRSVKKDAIGIAAMKGIHDTGDLIASIDYKLGRDKSSVVVGPGAAAATWQKKPWDNSSDRARRMSIKQKRMKMQFFKGYWNEFGTEKMGKRPFMNEAWDFNAPSIRRKVTIAVNRALSQASRG